MTSLKKQAGAFHKHSWDEQTLEEKISLIRDIIASTIQALPPQYEHVMDSYNLDAANLTAFDKQLKQIVENSIEFDDIGCEEVNCLIESTVQLGKALNMVLYHALKENDITTARLITKDTNDLDALVNSLHAINARFAPTFPTPTRYPH